MGIKEKEKYPALFSAVLKDVKEKMSKDGRLITEDGYEIPLFTAPCLLPAELWPYPVEEIRNSFDGATIIINDEVEYRELLILWSLLGGHVWAWHKGWKPADEDTSKLYSLNAVGLFRELYNTPPTHTLDDVRSAVLNLPDV